MPKPPTTYRNPSNIRSLLAAAGLDIEDLAAYLRESVQTVGRKAAGERDWRSGPGFNQQDTVIAYLSAQLNREVGWAEVWPHQGSTIREEEPVGNRVTRLRVVGGKPITRRGLSC